MRVLVRHVMHEPQDAWLAAPQDVDRHAAGQASFVCGRRHVVLLGGGWCHVVAGRRCLCETPRAAGPCLAAARQQPPRTEHGCGCSQEHAKTGRYIGEPRCSNGARPGRTPGRLRPAQPRCPQTRATRGSLAQPRAMWPCRLRGRAGARAQRRGRPQGRRRARSTPATAAPRPAGAAAGPSGRCRTPPRGWAAAPPRSAPAHVPAMTCPHFLNRRSEALC